MSPLLSSMLFAATTSAQLTTSIWQPKNYFGTDKIGYYGSVVNANSTHTTLALSYDNGTDESALGLAGSPITMTVGPTLWEVQENVRVVDEATASDANVLKVHCEQEPDATDKVNGTCIVSYGAEIARQMQCRTPTNEDTETIYFTKTHTYPARGSYSSGVETFTATFKPGSVSQSIPSWCSDQSYYPDGGYVSSAPVPKTDFATYQVIITAGTEKLNATQGASASLSSASPTGTQAMGSGGTATATGSTGGPLETAAAAELVRAGHVMMGLGVGVAAFFV